MASRQNSVKGKAKSGGSTKKKKASKGSVNESLAKVMAFIRSERGRKTGGLVLIITGIFLLLAFISHFFTGNQDQSLVLSEGALASDTTEYPANWLGSVGAFFGYLFINRGFGIMALLIPLYLGLWGFAFLENKHYKLAWKLLKFVLFAVIWGSLFFSFISFLAKGQSGMLGGGFGWYINETLFRYIGNIGVGLLIAVIFLIFMVVNFNTNLAFTGFLGKLMGGKEENPQLDPDAETNADETDENQDTEAETDEDAETEDEPEEDMDFVISVRTEENEEKQPEESTEKEPEEKNEKDGGSEDTGPKLEVVDEDKDPLLKLAGDDADSAVTLSVDTPDSSIETPSDGELELVIESATGDEEVTDIQPVDSGDNIYEKEEDTYEKIVPEDSQDIAEELEDVGDWEAYDPTKDLSDYQYPTIDLLKGYDTSNSKEVNRSELEENKNKIVTTLNHYKIEIKSIKATIGPTVTLYEIVPAPGIRISKIKNLEDDIALSLAALGIRIIAPIPGRGTIGIEIPNSNPEIVSMRSVLATEKFRDTKAELPIALGRTISNEVYIADLAKMPHLLIAGATGQGKSVGINGLISSILYKKHPSQVKFVLIDPKKVELSLYSALEHHFLARLESNEEAIITDTKQVINTLNSLCIEMDARYDLLKKAKVRNLREYNEKFTNRRLNPRKGHRFMPYIVLIIDEFADLMMTAGKEIEQPIARLAQLARAIGIHLVLATQRPSVNVITGIIKANFPARISFRVTSKVDSRTILDTGGADQLIGRGDLLLSTGSDIVRIQNSFIDTPEVDRLVDFIAEQRGYPEALFLPEVPSEDDEPGAVDLSDRDDMFDEAARLVVKHQSGSTSLIQRRLSLGYNRAGRIIDQLEAAGVVGPFQGSKARDVLIQDENTLEELLNSLI